MFPRHRQRGDVHGDAAIHVESPDQEETAAADDRSAEQYENNKTPIKTSIKWNITFMTS